MHWGARLWCALLFGPQMHWVGRQLERRAAEKAERERVFLEASGAERAAMLSEYRKALVAEAKAVAASKDGRRAKQLEKLQDGFKYSLTHVPCRTLAEIKHFQRPVAGHAWARPR